MIHKRWLYSALLILLLTACRSTPDIPTNPVSTPVPTATPTPTPTPVPGCTVRQAGGGEICVSPCPINAAPGEACTL